MKVIFGKRANEEKEEMKSVELSINNVLFFINPSSLTISPSFARFQNIITALSFLNESHLNLLKLTIF